MKYLDDNHPAMSSERQALANTDTTQGTQAERLLALFQGIQEGLLLLAPDSGQILDANPAFLHYLSLDLATARRLRLQDLCGLTESLRQWLQTGWHQAAPSSQSASFEIEFRASGQHRLPAEITLSRVGTGKAQYLAALVRDIRERRQREHCREVLRRFSALIGSFSTVEEAIAAALEAVEAIGTGSLCSIGLVTPIQPEPEWFCNLEAQALDLGRICADEASLSTPSWFGSVRELSPTTAHLLSGADLRFGGCIAPEGQASPSCRLLAFTREDAWAPVEQRTLQRIVSLLNAAVWRIHADWQLQQSEDRLRRLAYHDPLTQLPNRSLLNDRLTLACAHARRTNRLLAVCYLDLDGFKNVNDAYGHEFGDRLLIAVANALLEGIREDDTAARLGGDEFVLLLGGAERIQEIRLTLQRILIHVAQAVAGLGMGLTVSASVGVTVYPTDDVDQEILLRHADQAMYVAKNSLEENLHFFDPNQRLASLEAGHQYDLLKEAILGDRLLLHYQPQVDMRSGDVVRAEALLRLRKPDGRLAMPAQFLPQGMDNDSARMLDEWVIQQALGQVETWQAHGLELPVSVNINGSQLLQAGFAHRIERFLWEHPKVPIGSLHLEILETSALENIKLAAATIDACHALGVDFSVDDFGTGYSSLTYLRRLSVSALKLDRSFVIGMLEDADDFAIVEGVIALARTFHRQTIAEGVETELHGEMLVKAGCELAQGYYIARPMEGSAMMDWVAGYRHPESWALAARTDLVPYDSEMLRLETHHRQWLKNILQLAEERRAGSDLSPHTCHFGRWCRSDASTRFRNRRLFSEMADLHDSLHKTAGILLTERIRHNDQVATRVQEELLYKHLTLVQQLHQLSTQRRSSDRD